MTAAQKAEIRAHLGRVFHSDSTFSRSYALDGIEIKRSGDGRTVEAYAAIFDTPYEVRDQQGHYHEVIERTAFDAALRKGLPMALYNHGMTLHGREDTLSQVPIGSPVEVRPDQRGLYTLTRLNRSQLADSVLEAIRNGDITSYSFRGAIRRSTPERVPARRPGQPLPTVTRHELGLTDYGPTPVPMNAGARILAVRSRQGTPALSDAEARQHLENLLASLSDTDVAELAALAERMHAGGDIGAERSRLERDRARLRMRLMARGLPDVGPLKLSRTRLGWDALVAQLRAKGAHDPEGLARYIGGKKYGHAAFAAMAAAGRARHAIAHAGHSGSRSRLLADLGTVVAHALLAADGTGGTGA